MASPDMPHDVAHSQAFGESKLRPEAGIRLRAAFERSRYPMLIVDDQRRWVTGNTAACELLMITQEEIPWRAMDDFTPPEGRRRLEERWGAFLATGAAEGWYQLDIPDRGTVAVEFSATANVLPARHLSVFIPPDDISAEEAQAALAREATWEPVAAEGSGRVKLTERERQIMTLVATGHQSADIAQVLSLSPETVKSHVQNAMSRLGAHTRAHAVAIGLVTGQIIWKV